MTAPQSAFPFLLCQGRYQVESVFADGGGMGILYLARDQRCAGNHVLIKTTRYDGGDHARHFRYTLDEAQAHVEKCRKILAWEKKMLVRFRDEGLGNIPLATDYFLDASSTLMRAYEGKYGPFELDDGLLAREPYLVLERIDGELLEDKLHDPAWRQGLEGHLLTMSRELLTLLIKLHKPFDLQGQEACFLYQDLKPANILVSAETYFTLIDFGAVTLHLGGRTTEPTAGCITPGYAAPEAAREDAAHLDPRFDLYTLGATLWHAVSGQDPRELGQPFPLLSAEALKGQPVSPQFVHIVSKALAPDPEARYQSAAAMRKDVMRALRARLAAG